VDKPRISGKYGADARSVDAYVGDNALFSCVRFFDIAASAMLAGVWPCIHQGVNKSWWNGDFSVWSHYRLWVHWL